MSQQLANHLKSYGRNGDTELVHMTKGEIKGLQDLAMAHGGTLTINPDTGLAEAGFLKNILPAIAGAGLMMIPGMQAWGAGLIVGGAEALRTGDIGKGLTAGLGAYGGAGLGQMAGVGGSGTSVIPGDTAGFVKPAGTDLNVLASEVTNPVNTSASAIGKNALMAATPVIADAATPKPLETPTPEKSSGRYLAGDFRAFEPQRPNPYYRPMGLGYTGYAAEGGVMPDDLSYAVGGQVDPMQKMPNGGLAALQGMRDGYGAPQTTDGNMPQFSGGGKMSMREVEIKSGIFKDTNPNTANLGAADAAEYYVKNTAKKSKVPYAKMPKTSVESLGEIEVGPVKKAAMGGSIGGYSDGGRMLKGPGDGMSDSIPGVIGNKQPARLADGEFVVPADVVSHLGNGSTDAGAKRLYAMMDKVRKARTGTKNKVSKLNLKNTCQHD
jgi:hypothetical protein